MPPRTKTPVDTEGLPAKEIHLARLHDVTVDIPIVGLAPVIPHKWSEKALRLMREKQMAEAGTLRGKKEPKNPEEEADAHTYWLPDGRPGLPATAFKAAITEASRYYEGVTLTLLRRVIFVEGIGPEMLVPIMGRKSMREDTPRNSGGVPDLRYRNQFEDWSAILRVRFMPSVLSPTSVVALVDAAGRGGVGDWRPGAPKSNTGIYGTWRVDETRMGES